MFESGTQVFLAILDWQGTVRSLCLQQWMVVDVDSSGTASSIGVPGYDSLQFSGSFWVSCMFASPVVLLQWYFLTICPLCVRCVGKSSPCVNMISFVLLDSQGLFKLAVGSATAVWLTFSLLPWHPLLALIWSSLSPLMWWFFPNVRLDFRLKDRVLLCLQIPAMLLVSLLFISSPLFHFIYSYSQPMCTSVQNLLRDGWQGRQGHCPETPMIVLQFSHSASIRGAVAPLTSLSGRVGPTQFPGQDIKRNSCLLLRYKANKTGQFSEVLILLPSQSHFHPAHI